MAEQKPVIVIADEPADEPIYDDPYNLDGPPDPDHPLNIDARGRKPIPAERRLLGLLAAARRAVSRVRAAHDEGAEYVCQCSICQAADWLDTCMDIGFSQIETVLTDPHGLWDRENR